MKLPIKAYIIIIFAISIFSCNKSATESKSESLDISLIPTHVSTFGGNDGSIDLTVVGGNSPYEYEWSNGSDTKGIRNLVAGTYSVAVIDSDNQAANDTVYITEPEFSPFDFILYDDLLLSDVSDVSEELENNYHRIIDDLHVTNMPSVTVKIWGNYENFLNAMETDIGIRYTGATGYVFGREEIRLYYTNQASLTAVHEFVHLVSLKVNRSISNNPRWLWEAVALYESNDFVDPITLPYMVLGNYPTLEELNSDYNNSSNHYIYEVGYTIIEYIVQGWGFESVISLIRSYGNINYILEISIQDFESGWYQFIENEYL